MVKGQTGTPIPLMGDDIQQIVDAHNFFRSVVEPTASNMQRIVSFNKRLANFHLAIKH
jgi:hypothetical protein